MESRRVSQPPFQLSSWLVVVFAAVCGMTVANIYYAQALIGPITHDLDIPPTWAGTVVTLTQLGYGAGLFLIVPLADRMENRRLILLTVMALILSLVGSSLSHAAAPFMLCAFAIGLCSVGSQILLPLAMHFVAPERRGQIIGNIMGGLLTGIMLARPLANAIAAALGWRAVFGLSAGAMALIGGILWRVLPTYRPEGQIRYGDLLRSIGQLVVRHKTLRYRILYHGILFAVFNMFWTAVPLMLHDRFGLGQGKIALFSLAGAGGALAAPLAGRWADRGHARAATRGAVIGVGLMSFCTGLTVDSGWLLLTAMLALLLDAGVQTNQIVSQRAVYNLDNAARGRLNAAYMTAVFMAGAAGSLGGGALYSHLGWQGVSLVSALLCGIDLVVLFIGFRRGVRD